MATIDSAILCRGIRSLRIGVLAAFAVTMLTAMIPAQEVPCPDPQAAKVTFIRSRSGNCRGARLRLDRRDISPMVDVMISGHITHQNGVRLSGVILTLDDLTLNTTRTVVSDEMGNYLFANIPWGHRIQLTPSRPNYEFFPPSVIWEGIVEDEVWNFIAVGPPPPPPPPPANQPTLAWTSYFDNSPQLADFNGMIGRDSAGGVYVGGTSYIENDASGNTDIVLFKTDANGNRVWSRTFNGAGNYKDGLSDMAVDAAGNSYLAGYSYSADEGGGLRSYNYVVLKYNANGDLIWSRYYAGNPGYDDFAQSLKVDPAGNVYVGGYSWGVGTYANYAAVKYDTDGNQLWARRYAGGFGEIMNELEIDSSGNVYVTGYSNNSAAGGSEDIVTIKYNAAGDQLWLNRFNSAANDTDEGYEIEIDAAGNVLVLGQSYVNFSDASPIIHKINGASGSTVWTRTVNADPQRGEYPSALELDPAGNLILVGMLYDDVSYNVDAYVAKLDAEAAVLWTRSYDGPADEDYDGDPKLVIDTTGNIYLGVTSEGFANADIQVIKFTAAGQQEWTYRFGNPFFGDDWVNDYRDDVAQTTLLLDVQGNVYVAGTSYVPGQSTDLSVFKLEPIAQIRAVPFDFDGDRKADISVFRPETGVWWILRSSDGGFSATNWGVSTDRIVPADYDGDGSFDPGVYRDGIWYALKSSSGGYLINQFGLAGDNPVPTDFDNDGKADLCVFRQGIWHSLASGNGAYNAVQFGLASDIPIPADFDSNRRSDVAVFRGGVWYVRYQNELPMTATQFGIGTDKAVPADYDGDRRTDYAVYRQGTWWIWQSSTDSPRAMQWGIDSDVPVPADYDGDRKADFAVYRGGLWYILKSTDGTFAVVHFGLPTDIPVPSAYIR